jgi:hypothetical protein
MNIHIFFVNNAAVILRASHSANYAAASHFSIHHHPAHILQTRRCRVSFFYLAGTMLTSCKHAAAAA